MTSDFILFQLQRRSVDYKTEENTKSNVLRWLCFTGVVCLIVCAVAIAWAITRNHFKVPLSRLL